MLVCGVCGGHFQNGRCEFSVSRVSASNGDGNLMLVSISMFSGSEKPTRINIICRALVFFFKMAAILVNVAITSTQNKYMFLFVVYAFVYSHESPYVIALNTII